MVVLQARGEDMEDAKRRHSAHSDDGLLFIHAASRIGDERRWGEEEKWRDDSHRHERPDKTRPETSLHQEPHHERSDVADHHRHDEVHP